MADDVMVRASSNPAPDKMYHVIPETELAVSFSPWLARNFSLASIANLRKHKLRQISMIRENLRKHKLR